MINPKTMDEIEKMRKGGKVAARILNLVKEAAVPGVATGELDALAREEIEKAGMKPSFLGFHGYPAALCVSVNDEVVHGIPSKRILHEGDLCGVDLGIECQGYHVDTAVSFGVGKIDYEKKELLKITAESLSEAISMIKPGVKLGDVQNRIQKIIEGAGYSVVRDLTGHGIGKKLQDYPPIPNYGKPNTGLVLAEGYTLAIEPMVAAGDWHVKILPDDWTVVTADGTLAAHFEHTILVTKDGCEVITKE